MTVCKLSALLWQGKDGELGDKGPDGPIGPPGHPGDEASKIHSYYIMLSNYESLFSVRDHVVIKGHLEYLDTQ